MHQEFEGRLIGDGILRAITHPDATAFNSDHGFVVDRAFVAIRFESCIANEGQVFDVHEKICCDTSRSSIDRKLADHQPCSRCDEIESASQSAGRDGGSSDSDADESGQDPLKHDP